MYSGTDVTESRPDYQSALKRWSTPGFSICPWLIEGILTSLDARAEACIITPSSRHIYTILDPNYDDP